MMMDSSHSISDLIQRSKMHSDDDELKNQNMNFLKHNYDAKDATMTKIIRNVTSLPIFNVVVGRPNLHLISVILSKQKTLDGVSFSSCFLWTISRYKAYQASSTIERCACILISNLARSMLHLQLNLDHFPTGMHAKTEFKNI